MMTILWRHSYDVIRKGSGKMLQTNNQQTTTRNNTSFESSTDRSKMIFNPHKLGVHKILQHVPLNAMFDAPYKRAVKRAVNIADLRLIAKSRAHKVSRESKDSPGDQIEKSIC